VLSYLAAALIAFWPRWRAAALAFFAGVGTTEAGLVIHYAGYGLGGQRYEDVTLMLRGFIKQDRVNVPVSNTTFRSDPYPGSPKHVVVRYSYKGKTRETVRHENDQLVLPDESSSAIEMPASDTLRVDLLEVCHGSR